LIGDPENNATGGPTLEIAYGVGDGTFLPPRHIQAVFQAVATGDMNGDGYPDAVSAYGGEVSVWLNDAAGAGAAQARAFLKKSDRSPATAGPLPGMASTSSLSPPRTETRISTSDRSR